VRSDGIEDVEITPSSPPPRTRARPKTTRKVRPGGRAPTPPRDRAAARPNRSNNDEGVDLTERINGLFQSWVAAPLFGAGLAMRRRDLLADASAVEEHAPAISAALNDMAQENQQVRQVLERITKMGPYGAIIEPVAMLAAQIVTNHRQALLPITGRFFRAKSLDVLVGTQESLDEQIRQLVNAHTAASANGQAG
jgi:hypothetical protein